LKGEHLNISFAKYIPKVNNMIEYLQRFYEKLKKEYAGSLVKVKSIKQVEPNAKEYLNKLAKAGLIEKVRWGWYWVPDKIRDPLDFFEKDKGFKIVSCQTAASLWNQDFVHRDAYSLKVRDKSYGKALEEFAKRKGWRVQVEYVDKATNYKKARGVVVEDMDDTIIECMSRWAFVDAFATLYSNRRSIKLEDLSKKSYWKRIRGTNVRVRQALEYGCNLINESVGKEVFDCRRAKLDDEYLKREIEEAVEKVVELGQIR
jgi:predicted transcriptional regulator of viral defense system